MQPIYSPDYVNSIVPRHKKPEKLFEKTGYHAIQARGMGLAAGWRRPSINRGRMSTSAIRGLFDKLTGYHENMSEGKWLQRFLFLETVAGVPGMVAGMCRHMQSLRSMRRDNGWIHTLLEEAGRRGPAKPYIGQARRPSSGA
eukprot:scaffold2.g7117.t1